MSEDGSPRDPGVEGDDLVRYRERRWLLWFAVAGFAITLLGSTAGVVVGRAEDGDTEPLGTGAWALLIGLPIAGALLAAAIGAGFALWRRRRGSALFARSPLWELPTQKQRNHLVRALRRGQTIHPDQHDLALRTARDLTRRRGLVWLYLGLAALQVANLAIQDSWSRWLYLTGALLFLAAAGYWAWLVHRMHIAVRQLDTPTCSSDQET